MDAKIRKVVSQLKKASQAHARQAAMLEKMIKSNGKTKKEIIWENQDRRLTL